MFEVAGRLGPLEAQRMILLVRLGHKDQALSSMHYRECRRGIICAAFMLFETKGRSIAAPLWPKSWSILLVCIGLFSFASFPFLPFSYVFFPVMFFPALCGEYDTFDLVEWFAFLCFFQVTDVFWVAELANFQFQKKFEIYSVHCSCLGWLSVFLFMKGVG